MKTINLSKVCGVNNYSYLNNMKPYSVNLTDADKQAQLLGYNNAEDFYKKNTNNF